MTQFVRAANPIWWLPDLTGLPLNDQYYAFFLTNDLPYVPSPVYQYPNGMSPWRFPLQFQPSGTLPNNLYFDDTLVYRIEIRQGSTSADPLIWLIENFVPGEGSSSFNTSLLTAENMVTNPQFADILFVSPFKYTQGSVGNYSVNIAPGWRVDLIGSGSITFTQGTFSGDELIPGNPTYFLNINADNTWTSVKLIQRFSNNGALFAGGAIAIAFTAQATGSSPVLTVSYFPSALPGNDQNIFDQNITVGSFNAYRRASLINTSTNNQTDGAAYTEIQFNIPPGSNLSFTNVQITGQTDPLPTGFDPVTDAPIYQELTYERIEDHEFNVYKNSLVIQPKENLLVGWNFGLNPWQFIAQTPTLPIARTAYIADQTIIHQQTNNSFLSSKGDSTNNFGLVLKANTGIGVGANKFAIFQYIDFRTMRPFFGQKLSCFVRAAILSPNSTATNIKMRLIYRTSGDAIPVIGASEPITGWDANGDLTFETGWTPILPINDVNYQLPIFTAPPINNFPGMAYNQFQLPVAPSAIPYLGVVIYITAPINTTLGSEDTVIFDRISMVPNDFGMDASIETFDESLRKCQAYYEKSYDVDVAINASVINGSSTVEVVGTAGTTNAYGLERSFKVEKIRTPIVVWQATTPFAANAVTTAVNGNVPATPNAFYASTKSTGIPTLTGDITDTITGAQWLASSLLGIF